MSVFETQCTVTTVLCKNAAVHFNQITMTMIVMMTNLPVFDGIEAFVDAEVSTVERVVSPADDLLQLGHVPLQLRVDVLVRVQYGHVVYWPVYSTVTSWSRHVLVMYWSVYSTVTSCTGRCTVRSRRVLVGVQYGHVVYWSVNSTVTSRTGPCTVRSHWSV